jgi:anaphase-promoting complex subunit 6
MEKYLREWRQEALNRCQYDTAIFVADKLLALTGMLNRTTDQRILT